jgi:hypothetical protein
MKGGVKYIVPSTFYTILYFYMNIFIFALLTWYFDHVDSSNRGKTYGYFFFLDKSYWCGSKRVRSNINKNNYGFDQAYSETLEDRRRLEPTKNKENNSCIYKIY